MSDLRSRTERLKFIAFHNYYFILMFTREERGNVYILGLETEAQYCWKLGDAMMCSDQPPALFRVTAQFKKLEICCCNLRVNGNIEKLGPRRETKNAGNR